MFFRKLALLRRKYGIILKPKLFLSTVVYRNGCIIGTVDRLYDGTWVLGGREIPCHGANTCSDVLLSYLEGGDQDVL